MERGGRVQRATWLAGPRGGKCSGRLKAVGSRVGPLATTDPHDGWAGMK